MDTTPDGAGPSGRTGTTLFVRRIRSTLSVGKHYDVRMDGRGAEAAQLLRDFGEERAKKTPLSRVQVLADFSTVVLGPFVAHVLGHDPELYDIGCVSKWPLPSTKQWLSRDSGWAHSLSTTSAF